MAGAAPEAVRSESREPDHLEIRILKTDAHVLGAHAEAHADAAVHFDPVRQLAARDQVIDVTLREIGGRRADVPVILERDRAHAALGCLDGDLNHVLRTMHEIGKRMDVTIDGALQQLVFYTRIDLQHLRVVFEHLVKIILGVQFAHPRNRQRPYPPSTLQRPSHPQQNHTWKFFLRKNFGSKVQGSRFKVRTRSVQAHFERTLNLELLNP